MTHKRKWLLPSLCLLLDNYQILGKKNVKLLFKLVYIYTHMIVILDFFSIHFSKIFLTTCYSHYRLSNRQFYFSSRWGSTCWEKKFYHHTQIWNAFTTKVTNTGSYRGVNHCHMIWRAIFLFLKGDLWIYHRDFQRYITSCFPLG